MLYVDFCSIAWFRKRLLSVTAAKNSRDVEHFLEYTYYTAFLFEVCDVIYTIWKMKIICFTLF